MYLEVQIKPLSITAPQFLWLVERREWAVDCCHGHEAVSSLPVLYTAVSMIRGGDLTEYNNVDGKDYKWKRIKSDKECLLESAVALSM